MCLGSLDFSRGAITYITTWVWGQFSTIIKEGEASGKKVGITIGSGGPVDGLEVHSNDAVFVNEKLCKLNAI